jgi:hypothetical protein
MTTPTAKTVPNWHPDWTDPAKTVQPPIPQLRVLNAQERVKGAVYYFLSDGVDITVFDQPISMNDQRWNYYATRVAVAANSHQALVDALVLCRRELSIVKDGSTGCIPNSIYAFIPEAIETADAALASVQS